MGIYLVIGMVIYSLLLEFKWGKTIGKVITMTKVIFVPTGEIPNFVTCIGRSLSRLIPLDPLSYLFSLKPAGWHDRISNTRVIRDQNSYLKRFTLLNKGVIRLLLVLSVSFSLIFGIATGVEVGYGDEEVILGSIIFSLIYLIGFWLFIRLCLWIYDGFKEDKKQIHT